MKKTIMSQWNKIARLGNQYRRKPFVNLSVHLKKNSKILDLGSGAGGFSKELKKFGKVIHSDIAIDMLKLGKIENSVNCDAVELPFKKESFDAVTSFAMFHHLPTNKDRINFLNEVYRVLKKEGISIVTFGYFEELKNEKVKVSWQGKISRDYYSISRESLEKLLEKSKFSNYSIESELNLSEKVKLIHKKIKYGKRFNNFIIIMKKHTT